MVMRTFHNMEKYIEYVEGEINAGAMPKTFDGWHEMKRQADTLTKWYTVKRWSENTKSWPSWHIGATSEQEANRIADQRLIDFELKHALQNKSNGRETTPEEQREIMLRKIESMDKQDRKRQDREAQKRADLLKKIQSELNLK